MLRDGSGGGGITVDVMAGAGGASCDGSKNHAACDVGYRSGFKGMVNNMFKSNRDSVYYKHNIIEDW